VEIVVRGRNCEVTDGFRRHTEDKVNRLERLDNQLIRVDVEITEERNPRRAGESERVEITVLSRGPAIRAEAATADRYSALDIAMSKLETRMRRAASRRHDYRKGDAAARVEKLAAPGAALAAAAVKGTQSPSTGPSDGSGADPGSTEPWDNVTHAGGVIVREKTHEAEAMSLDQALYEMELLGHDFFLFVDESLGMPSVVYRRKGYDYGVIRLKD
jgi:ribosomal subunit interface protein